MMPSQTAQNKKSSRKKIVSASDSANDDRTSSHPSSSGAQLSRADEQRPPRITPSGSSRKFHSQRGTQSNRAQKQQQNSSDAKQMSQNSSGSDKSSHSRQSRAGRAGESGQRTVGARFVKQMAPGRAQEEVYTALGYCEPYDARIKRPKPAVQVYQNRTFINSTLTPNNNNNNNNNGVGNRQTAGPSGGWNTGNNRGASSQYPGGFGAPIPEDVLNDICFRFLINIPEEEKSNVIRICFQIELAHWFYIDFYCKGDAVTPKCNEIGLRDFIRQIFNHCDFLSEFSGQVDQVIEKWREYKSSVPTYGAILLDSSLNYVLLVQGYYARNSWGFPKGKVNESEEPTDCAAREVLEEVGFDISERIRDNRLIQKFINETLTRLYIVTDVPVDFQFAPKTRNEIGKIQWFSVWDLPTDRNNQKACERIGLVPNNFYTVMPFVNDLQAYIIRHQNKRNKMKPKMINPVKIGERSASAFDPVLPHQKLEFIPSVFTSLFPGVLDPCASATTGSGVSSSLTLQNQNASSVPSLISNRHSPTSAFFKPLSTTSTQIPVSFTGPSFLQLVTSGVGVSDLGNNAAQSPDEHMRSNAVARPVATVPKPRIPPLGHPVYEVSKRHNNNNNNTNNNDRKSLSVDVKEEIKEEPLVAICAQQPHQQLKQQSQPQTNTAMNSMVQQDQTNLLMSTNDISPKSQSSIVGTGVGASSVTGGPVAGASAPGVCVQKPKETSAQRRARRLRNRKSERETDGGDERLLNMTGTAANASLPNNAADELLMNLSMDLNLNLSTIIPTETQFHLQLSPQTSHINTNSLLMDQTPFSPRGDEPMIQLCEAWSNFKLDVSRLFVEVA